jgi:aspartyl-tRNA(Asn)/glutamyl-tRNA(Gln) amidotransferase subunit B
LGKDRLAEVLVKWEAVIGLEVHTELTSLKTKMFCGCPVAFGGEVNTRVCPVCLGLPGALPVPNRSAIDATVLAGLALDCEIARHAQFHRKNYFYPDMPKDYQISQYDVPFCLGGHVDVEVDGPGAGERAVRDGVLADDGEAGYATRVGITRIHLEEDTGKMIHVGGSEGRIAGATHSLVDFNRAGTALMELVSEPDVRTPEEARRFAQKLRLVFLSLHISDCNMEEGSMRVDANVSVRPRGQEEFGVKAEVKNMNSFKALHDALAYEIVRQSELIEGGGTVVQETRHWDVGAKRTSSLRSKEEAHDYRYFPEPDMVPFTFGDAYVEEIRERLPELPDARKARIARTYGIPAHDARVLSEDADLEAYYVEAVENAGIEYAKPLANWVLGDLSAQLNAEGIPAWGSNVTPRKLARIVQLVADGTISGKQAKEVFAEIAVTDERPLQVVERLGMRQVSDASELEAIVDRVLAANPGQVEQYRAGKAGLIGYFVGAVMRETGGQANPAVVNELLAKKLGA